MGPQHSFPLEDAFSFVRAEQRSQSLEQANPVRADVGARFRWNATRALQILRSNNGKQVPPPIQRMRSDDLMAPVFPEQVGCQENLTGPLQIPDHPLTRQTVTDCLHEANGRRPLIAVMERIESGEIRVHARDTTEPSPFAHEILNAKALCLSRRRAARRAPDARGHTAPHAAGAPARPRPARRLRDRACA